MTDSTEDPAEPTLDEPDLEIVPIEFFDTEPTDPPRYFVIGDHLVAQTPDGPLRLRLYVAKRLIGYLEGRPPRQQLYIVLRDRGEGNLFRRILGARQGAALVRRIENLDYVDSRELVRKFWQAYGQREQVRLGGIFALRRTLAEHRAAISFDLRDRLGLTLEDLGTTVSWRESIDLVGELRREWGTHLRAAEQNWSLWPGTAS